MNQSQPALTEEESNWIAGFAGRLRLIQADASTAPAEKRREYLQEAIMRRLKELPETHRSRYLAALLDRFPVAGRIYEPVSQPLSEQPAPAPVPETPEQILHRFLDAIQGLPDKERRGFAKLLINSGVIPDSPPAASPTLELSPELRRALGLPVECQPRLDRLAQLAVQLIEVCSTLDQTALKTLNQIDPRSPLLRRPQDIRGSAARFLAGQRESA